MRITLLAAIATISGLAGGSVAHSQFYALGDGDAQSAIAGTVEWPHVCDAADHPLTGNPGFVRFCVGHIVPNPPTGKAKLVLQDDGIQPASGIYCQDLDGDDVCGEGNEPRIHFCDSVVLVAGANWATSRDVFVFIDGPLLGNSLATPCSGVTYSGGTSGRVTHLFA